MADLVITWQDLFRPLLVQKSPHSAVALMLGPDLEHQHCFEVAAGLFGVAVVVIVVAALAAEALGHLESLASSGTWVRWHNRSFEKGNKKR